MRLFVLSCAMICLAILCFAITSLGLLSVRYHDCRTEDGFQKCYLICFMHRVGRRLCPSKCGRVSSYRDLCIPLVLSFKLENNETTYFFSPFHNIKMLHSSSVWNNLHIWDAHVKFSLMCSHLHLWTVSEKKNIRAAIIKICTIQSGVDVFGFRGVYH